MNYKKIYFDAFNYPMHQDTFVPSELSGDKSQDLHHIVNRENRIENLMALTRAEHIELGEIKSKMVFLLETHRKCLKTSNIAFDDSWFNEKIKRYE